jgi:hypothetical protein
LLLGWFFQLASLKESKQREITECTSKCRNLTWKSFSKRKITNSVSPIQSICEIWSFRNPSRAWQQKVSLHTDFLCARKSCTREKWMICAQNHPSNICTVHRSVYFKSKCKQQLKQKGWKSQEKRLPFFSFPLFFHLATHAKLILSLRDRTGELLSYDGVAAGAAAINTHLHSVCSLYRDTPVFALACHAKGAREIISESALKDSCGFTWGRSRCMAIVCFNEGLPAGAERNIYIY